MVKREHLRLRRELLDIASGAVPGLSLRAERTRLTASLSADGITFSALPSILARMRRTGDRHIADAIPCMLAKIEGNAVRRALELAGVQFIDADDSGGEGVRLRRR